MSRYLITDLPTGRRLLCVLNAKTPAAAKATATRLIGWERPDFRGAHEIGEAPTAPTKRHRKVWVRLPLHGFTRLYVDGLPALSLGTFACISRAGIAKVTGVCGDLTGKRA